MEEQHQKCEKLERDRAKFCRLMDLYLQDDNAHAKGFSCVVVQNFKTLEYRLLGVAYKNRARDQGVMLNTCPWCSSSLIWWEIEDKVADVQNQQTSDLSGPEAKS